MHATCIYCGLSMKLTMRKMPHGMQILNTFVEMKFLCEWVLQTELPVTNLKYQSDCKYTYIK